MSKVDYSLYKPKYPVNTESECTHNGAWRVYNSIGMRWCELCGKREPIQSAAPYHQR